MDSLIFDVDGTLWNSTPQVARSWRRTMKAHGMDAGFITAERLTKEFGKTMDAIAISLFPKIPEKKAIDILRDCCERENTDLLTDRPPLYDGVARLFAELKRRGIPVGIVSNCQAGYIEVLLKDTGLAPLVAGHLCPGDTGFAKARNIRILADRLGLKDPAYVGDTLGDFTATKEAGLPFIFASYGFGFVSEPDYKIKAPLDILNLPGIR